MLTASPETAKRIAENWQQVSHEVAEAVRSSGREPGSVEIIGVTKYVDVDLTAQLFDAGCKSLGENRPQNLWNKSEQCSRQASARRIGI